MRISSWFLLISVLFVTCLITANIIAVKLIDLFGLVLPAAVIIFPLSYIIGDVLTEVYGYAAARRVIWLGFLCNLVVVIVIWIVGLLFSVFFWQGQNAYAAILGYTPRLLGASFIAYLIGEFANSFVLAKMKVATNGRWLWTRTIGSTIVGEGLDSLVFISIAFAGVIPLEGLANAIVAQWGVKVAYEILATPLTYWVVVRLKRAERIDVYDRDTNFNPIAFAE